MSKINNISTFYGVPITVVSKPTPSPIAGEVYVDTKTGKSLVYDGRFWIEITTFASPGAEMWNENSVEVLCEKHPGLAELKENLDEATEKFQAYLALVKEHKE